MRLGGPLGGFDTSTPDAWIEANRQLGYRAASLPLNHEADDETVRAYAKAAKAADLVIAEVPAFGVNPIHPDAAKQKEAIERCQRRLHQAELAGANCCVNITGSRDPDGWASIHPDNLTEATFDLIVESVRRIVDAVNPTRSCWALETMPWVWPDSADSYLRLIEAIDRKGVAVHLDVVNLINCPARAYDTTAVIHDCFDKLGPMIRSCHAKDILLHDKLTVHLDEVRPGQGDFDQHTFLKRAAALDPEMPIILEHLPNQEEYKLAADHMRKVAEEIGESF